MPSPLEIADSEDEGGAYDDDGGVGYQDPTLPSTFDPFAQSYGTTQPNTSQAVGGVASSVPGSGGRGIPSGGGVASSIPGGVSTGGEIPESRSGGGVPDSEGVDSATTTNGERIARSGGTAMRSTGSTDPVYFQAVYDAQRNVARGGGEPGSGSGGGKVYEANSGGESTRGQDGKRVWEMPSSPDILSITTKKRKSEGPAGDSEAPTKKAKKSTQLTPTPPNTQQTAESVDLVAYRPGSSQGDPQEHPQEPPQEQPAPLIADPVLLDSMTRTQRRQYLAMIEASQRAAMLSSGRSRVAMPSSAFGELLEIEAPPQIDGNARTRLRGGEETVAQGGEKKDVAEENGKKKRGRPRKRNGTSEGEVVLGTSDVLIPIEEVEVPLPGNKRQRGRPKRAREVKVVEILDSDDDSDDEGQTVAVVSKTPSLVEEKPVKRGRVKKVRGGEGLFVEEVKGTEEDVKENLKEDTEEEVKEDVKGEEAKEEKDETKTTDTKKAPDETPKTAPKHNPPAIKQPALPRDTKPAVTAARPLYRVGLSRKSRVPPLLKIVRK